MSGVIFYGLLAVVATIMTAINLDVDERGWAVAMGICGILFAAMALLSAVVGA